VVTLVAVLAAAVPSLPGDVRPVPPTPGLGTVLGRTALKTVSNPGARRRARPRARLADPGRVSRGRAAPLATPIFGGSGLSPPGQAGDDMNLDSRW